MSKITPTFLLLSLALLVWSVSAGLSSFLAEDFIRRHGKEQMGQGSAAAPPELDVLRKTAENQPESVEAHLNLAYGILRQAYAKGDGSLLMDAVKSFHRVLELSPDNPDALLGLATLCLEAGIIDKALEYYPRYLAKRPDDLRAKSDYALALARGGQEQEAVTTLNEVLQSDSKFFPALISMAMVLRVKGDVAGSEEYAKRAKANAPDAETAGRVDSFLAGLASAGEGPAQAAHSHSHGSADAMSPGQAVAEFFNGHPIVGPKVERITWPQPETARIELKEFPMDQMPPFAKAKFISSIKERFEPLPEKIKLQLIDAGSGSELLQLEVGGGAGAAAAADDRRDSQGEAS